MSKIKYTAALMVLLFASTTTWAATVNITPISYLDDCWEISCWTYTGENNNAALDAYDVEMIVGETDNLVLFYKSDQEGDSGLGNDSGLFADSYDTTFSNSSSDPEDALIDYISGLVIDTCGTLSCYLVVKDGDADPGNYIFDLSDLSYAGLEGAWDGIMDIFLEGFWPNDGAISNIAIYGVVPLPAAFWLFGTALIGFIGISRRTAV